MKAVCARASMRGVALAATAFALLVVGCRGEDRPANVEVIGGGGFVSISGADDTAGGVPTGVRYTGSTNQDLATAAAQDLRDLRAVVNVAIDGRPVDWARATQFYEAGRNQRATDGSVRSLASLADTAAHGQFPGGEALYGRPMFIDGLIRDGLAGTGLVQGRSENARRAAVERGVQMLLYARTLHALGRAETLVATDPSAAGAAVDEAWAYVAGPADADGARLTALLGVGINLENAASLPGRLTRPLEAAFITARAAAEKQDAATLGRYATEARGALATIFYTGTLRSLAQAEVATREDLRDAQLADALASFQSVRGAVAAVSPEGAARIEAVLGQSPGQPLAESDVTGVYRAMNEPAVLGALGIPSAFRLPAETRR